MIKLIFGMDNLIFGIDNLIDGSITTVTFCKEYFKFFLSKKTIMVLLFSLLSPFYGWTQPFTISGYVTDKETGEKLIAASVFDKQSMQGTTTNNYGFFSLTLSNDSIDFFVSYVGYQTFEKKLVLSGSISMNIALNPTIELQAVNVSAEKVEDIQQTTQMSTISVPVKQITKIPALLGEVDVLKAIQLLPGVQSGTEGASGLYVRGGGPDQNLVLLDGTPVYNVSHLFGFFSVFNANAIKNVTLIKGGFPARYGGRLSSVLEINMKEGNLREYKGEATIGLIASKFTIEGPIKKDKSSFIVSGRRTYIDILMQPFIRTQEGNQNISTGYYFYDLNGKVNYKINDNNWVYLSIYNGNDKFYYKNKPYSFLSGGIRYEEESKANIGWGNITSALRWNHQFNNKLFSNITATYSRYRFLISDYEAASEETDSTYTQTINSLTYFSGIYDWNGKIDFDYMPLPSHYIRFGLNGIYHTFQPGATNFSYVSQTTNIDSTIGNKNIFASEFALYGEDDWKISNHLKANLGLHFSGFLVNKKFYYSVEPRISGRYLFNNNWSVKASYAQMQQYIHLLTNSNIGLPTDLWVPATDSVTPQKSQQAAFGVAKTLQKKYLFSVEGYYKWMNNLITYKEGANFINSSDNWEDKIEQGKGWSYGAELFLQKKTGKLTGWIGYTLSWTFRQFENLNFGEPFPYKYDRRHDISIVGSYKINKFWDISATWVYGTGNALTLPVIRYFSFQPISDYYAYYYADEIEYFDKRNDFRMAAYHRLDIGFSNHKPVKHGIRIWNFGAYNVYNRRNPFYYYFSYDNRGNRVLKRVSLFPIIPSISFTFKF